MKYSSIIIPIMVSLLVFSSIVGLASSSSSNAVNHDYKYIIVDQLDNVYYVRIRSDIFIKHGSILVYDDKVAGVEYEKYLSLLSSEIKQFHESIGGKGSIREVYTSVQSTNDLVGIKIGSLSNEFLEKMSKLGLSIKSIIIYDNLVEINTYNTGVIKLSEEYIYELRNILLGENIINDNEKIVIFMKLDPPGYDHDEVISLLRRHYNELEELGVYSIGRDLTGLCNVLVDKEYMMNKNVTQEEVIETINRILNDKYPVIIAFTHRVDLELGIEKVDKQVVQVVDDNTNNMDTQTTSTESGESLTPKDIDNQQDDQIAIYVLLTILLSILIVLLIYRRIRVR